MGTQGSQDLCLGHEEVGTAEGTMFKQAGSGAQRRRGRGPASLQLPLGSSAPPPPPGSSAAGDEGESCLARWQSGGQGGQFLHPAFLHGQDPRRTLFKEA